MGLIEKRMEILEQLRPVFIDSFVEVYGEKHKKKIEEKINSCVFVFFEGNFDYSQFDYLITSLKKLIISAVKLEMGIDVDTSEDIHTIVDKCVNREKTKEQVKEVLIGLIEAIDYYEDVKKRKNSYRDNSIFRANSIFLECSSNGKNNLSEIKSVVQNIDSDNSGAYFLSIEPPIIAIKSPLTLSVNTILHEINHALANEKILEIIYDDGKVEGYFSNGIRDEEKSGDNLYPVSQGNLVYEILNEYITREVLNVFNKHTEIINNEIVTKQYNSDYTLVDEALGFPIKSILDFEHFGSIIKDLLITADGQKIFKIFGKNDEGKPNYSYFNTLFSVALTDIKTFFELFAKEHKEDIEKNLDGGLGENIKDRFVKMVISFYHSTDECKKYSALADYIKSCVLCSYIDYLSYEEEIKEYKSL